MSKVLIVAPSLNLGGSEKQAVKLANALSANKYETLFVSLKKDEDIKDLLSSKCELYEFNMSLKSTPLIYSTGKSIIKYFINLNNLKKIIEKDTIIISFLFHASLTGYILKFLTGCKHIVTIRSDRFTKRSSKELVIRKKIMKYICKNSDFIVFNSEKSQKKYNKLFNLQKNSVLIDNLIDEGKVSISEKNFNSNDLTGLYVGRLDDLKNLENLFLSLNGNLKKNINLDIYGEGRNKEKYLKLIADHKLHKNIKFQGLALDIIKKSQKYDFLILTSFHEGLPNVVLESMCNYLPVISTRVGDVTKLISENRGIFINGFDKDSIEKAIFKYMSMPTDEKLSIIQYAHSYMDHNFNNKNTIQKWKKLI